MAKTEQQIEAPKRCTLVLINTLGLPIARKVTVHRAKVQTAEYQQQSLTLYYSIEKSRKMLGHNFKSEVALFPGWHEVKGAFNGSGCGEWESFDANAFEAMCSQIDQPAIFKLN